MKRTLFTAAFLLIFIQLSTAQQIVRDSIGFTELIMPMYDTLNLDSSTFSRGGGFNYQKECGKGKIYTVSIHHGNIVRERNQILVMHNTGKTHTMVILDEVGDSVRLHLDYAVDEDDLDTAAVRTYVDHYVEVFGKILRSEIKDVQADGKKERLYYLEDGNLITISEFDSRLSEMYLSRGCDEDDVVFVWEEE